MRRSSALFALFAVCTCVCGQDIRDVLSVSSVRVRCEPARPVVGEGCRLVLELDVDRRVGLGQLSVFGLPEGKNDPIVYGAFENLADGTSATPGHVVKRIRCPLRFSAPFSREVSLEVRGTVGVTVSTPYRDLPFSQDFNRRLAPLRLEARPLPEKGRPANFSGAVGRRFAVRQSLSRDHVRPNDLIKVTYTLEFDDYCPTNVFPNIERLSKDFLVYPLNEVERTEGLATNRVTWTQDLVPRTAQATNTAFASFHYYNPQTGRYELAHADPLPLVFVSTEEASKENTSLVVTAPAEDPGQPGAGDAKVLVLHFAPSDGSPVIARVALKPDAPVKELATWNGWRRLETPEAIGWTKSR